jgi:hypothetical protein
LVGNRRIQNSNGNKKPLVRLPGVEPGSIAWKAIILTVGLQTPYDICTLEEFIKQLNFNQELV